MTKQFDLSVIGTGNAASTTRLPVVKPDDGSRSSILFRLPEPVLFGCDPEKVIVGAAELVGWQDGSEERRSRGGPATGLARSGALQACRNCAEWGHVRQGCAGVERA